MISREPLDPRTCAICGSAQIVPHPGGHFSPYRCQKHIDRNPCAIEGCRRTTSAASRNGDRHSGNIRWICPDHWRRLVPPRSRARRAYHAHFRGARKFGWTQERTEAFWRFWILLVRRARRRAAEGYVDVAAINRTMGWEDPQ